MEAAELAAHGSVWIPSEHFEPRHGRTAQVLARHVDKRICTADHPTSSQAECRHSAILLEGTIRVRKRVPWHSCKRSCILISGRSQLVSQIERLCLKDSLENMRPQVERLWLYKSNAPCSGESSTEFRTHLLLTCGSRPDYAIMRAVSGKLLSGETVMAARPFNDNGRSANGNRRCVWRAKARKGKHAKGKKGKDKGKGKHKGKHEGAVLSLRAYCGHCGKWRGQAKKTVVIRRLLPKWMRGNLSSLQTAVRAAARESHHQLLRLFSSWNCASPRRDGPPR